MTKRRSPFLPLLILSLAACGSDEESDSGSEVSFDREHPPTARMDIVESFREDRDAVRHASDGGGRAWLENIEGQEVPMATAGMPGSWVVVYEAGPLGVQEGGHVFFQVPPFWDWSWPQSDDRDSPGYTEVTTEADGILLEPDLVDRGLLGIKIGGRNLQEGEQLRIHYGAGPRGARADRYAERDSRLWIAVDGDGDGIRSVLPDSPVLDVAAGPPARLLLLVPGTVATGDHVRLTAAVVDALGSRCRTFVGSVRIESQDDGLVLPSEIVLREEDGGARTVDVEASRDGVFRVRGSLDHEDLIRNLRAVSNPVAVGGWSRILFGDLHGHSNFSDGTGVPEDYFSYARDVAALDFAALTDHDHWGVLFMDQHPEMWDEIKEEVRAFNDPGRFVSLLAYEWTSWIHGHRHVVYFEDEGEVYSSLDPAYETPEQLWEVLAGQPALTFAHHSAGGPVATNWAYPPPRDLEPVTEVASVHGSSEAADSPNRIYSPVPGNYVRDVLDRGYQLGFIGSGDGHDGHPGLVHLASPTGGLAAVYSESLTREGIREALQARRVYATSGSRMLLDVHLGDYPMGADVRESTGPVPEELRIRVVGQGPLLGLEVIRSGEIVVEQALDGILRSDTRHQISGLAAGEYIYVRITELDPSDGRTYRLAWSSPIFIVE